MLMISFAIAARILRRDFDQVDATTFLALFGMFDVFLFIGIAVGVFSLLEK